MSGIKRWYLAGRYYEGMKESGEGEYVLHSDHEEEVDRLRAELAAKSKDAERYRWLQMQSPYRFKKIQDACVIDSVDVLYFKADRFNELLDAAMGDGNGR